MILLEQCIQLCITSYHYHGMDQIMFWTKIRQLMSETTTVSSFRKKVVSMLKIYFSSEIVRKRALTWYDTERIRTFVSKSRAKLRINRRKIAWSPTTSSRSGFGNTFFFWKENLEKAWVQILMKRHFKVDSNGATTMIEFCTIKPITLNLQYAT